MKEKRTKTVAAFIKKGLDIVLQTEANTTTCAFIYQPKAASDLKKFKKRK